MAIDRKRSTARPPTTDGPLTPTGAKSASARRIRYAVGTLALIVLVRTTGMLPVFRDSLQRYLNIDDRVFGFLFSIGALCGLVTMLAGGTLVDRYGPRAILRICLMGVAGAMLLIVLAGRQWVLVAAALGVGGLFAGPLGIAVNVYLIRLFPRNRRRILSLRFAAGSVGDLVFASVAEGLLCLTQAFATITFAMVLRLPLALAALVILSASFLYRKRAGLGTTEAQASRWRWHDMLLPRRVVFLVILTSLHAVADTLLWTWMPRFLGSESFSVRPIGPGFVLSAFAVAYLLSRVALALVPEHYGRSALMILPGLMGGCVFIGGILTRNYLCAAAGYVLGGGLWSAEFPMMLSVVAREEPRRFGAAMALQGMLTAAAVFLGMNAMGVLVSRVAEASMWKVMLLPAGVFPVIGVGAALWLVLCGRSTRSQGRQ